MRENDCNTNLPPKTAEMAPYYPWEISANNDKISGWERQLCVICNN